MSMRGRPGDASSGEERWHLSFGLPWIVLGIGLVWYLDRRTVRDDLGWGDPNIG